MPISLGNSGNTATYDPMGYALAEEKLAFEKEQAEKQLREQRIQRMFQSGMSAAQAVNANMQREKDRQFQAAQAAQAQQDRMNALRESQRFTTSERMANQGMSRANMMDNAIIDAEAKYDGMIADRSAGGYSHNANQQKATSDTQVAIADLRKTLAQRVEADDIPGADRVRKDILSKFGELSLHVPKDRVKNTITEGGRTFLLDKNGEPKIQLPAFTEDEERTERAETKKIAAIKQQEEIMDKGFLRHTQMLDRGMLTEIQKKEFMRENSARTNASLKVAGYNFALYGPVDPSMGAAGTISNGGGIVGGAGQPMSIKNRQKAIERLRGQYEKLVHEFVTKSGMGEDRIPLERAEQEAIEILYRSPSATDYLNATQGGEHDDLAVAISRRRGYQTRGENENRIMSAKQLEEGKLRNSLSTVNNEKATTEMRINAKLEAERSRFKLKRYDADLANLGQYRGGFTNAKPVSDRELDAAFAEESLKAQRQAIEGSKELPASRPNTGVLPVSPGGAEGRELEFFERMLADESARKIIKPIPSVTKPMSAAKHHQFFQGGRGDVPGFRLSDIGQEDANFPLEFSENGTSRGPFLDDLPSLPPQVPQAPVLDMSLSTNPYTSPQNTQSNYDYYNPFESQPTQNPGIDYIGDYGLGRPSGLIFGDDQAQPLNDDYLRLIQDALE